MIKKRKKCMKRKMPLWNGKAVVRKAGKEWIIRVEEINKIWNLLRWKGDKNSNEKLNEIPKEVKQGKIWNIIEKMKMKKDIEEKYELLQKSSEYFNITRKVNLIKPYLFHVQDFSFHTMAVLKWWWRAENWLLEV